MLKVCFVIASFGQGGAQRQCITLLNQLQNMDDIEVSLVYGGQGEFFEDLRLDNLKAYRWGGGGTYSIRTLYSIRAILNKIGPDVVFSWLQASDVYVGLLRMTLPRFRWVVAERDSSYPKNWRFLLRRMLCRNADLIIANSAAGQAYWERAGYDCHKIRVIPNIVLAKRPVMPKRRDKYDNPLIVFAGRLEQQKNITTLVDAFISLSIKHPNWRFIIVGDGSFSELVDSKLAVAGTRSVQRRPFTKEIDSVYLCADVFVNVSLHEGTPNTVLENIYYGNLIVASYIKEHVDILGEEYPYYVRDLQSSEMVSRVVENCVLYSDQHVHDIMRHGSEVLANMTKEKVGSDYFDVFAKLYKA